MRPRVWVMILAMLLGMFAQSLTGQPAPDWRYVYARTARAVLPIQSWDAMRGQWFNSCTAKAIGSEWWTEAHCIDGAGRTQYINAGVLTVSGIWQDIALLEDVTDPDWLEPLEIAAPVWPGQTVAVLGYGWGARQPTVALGAVTARDDAALDRW